MRLDRWTYPRSRDEELESLLSSLQERDDMIRIALNSNARANAMVSSVFAHSLGECHDISNNVVQLMSSAYADNDIIVPAPQEGVTRIVCMVNIFNIFSGNRTFYLGIDDGTDVYDVFKTPSLAQWENARAPEYNGIYILEPGTSLVGKLNTTIPGTPPVSATCPHVIATWVDERLEGDQAEAWSGHSLLETDNTIETFVEAPPPGSIRMIRHLTYRNRDTVLQAPYIWLYEDPDYWVFKFEGAGVVADASKAYPEDTDSVLALLPGQELRAANFAGKTTRDCHWTAHWRDFRLEGEREN